ncbi:hypothetical protein [Microvirgula aerodenitrificans]|uniref:hypothetical protein n=1 Tax=Microvirgula aerodenitrificans TaxID=57480 RepID=UPI00190227D0|nr:hypothetical protein [Microvirgula aerodenitrificans]
MTRTTGSKNIKLFEKRNKVESADNAEIKHLAKATSATALEKFKEVLNNQINYIQWIESRHSTLIKLKRAAGERSPKDLTYRKYKWYAEQNSLLEAINAFEVFYKQSAINLAKALRNYVPPERIKGAVDSKVLWSVSGKISISELIFEHQLYHDLDSIDAATQSIVQDKRYNKSNLKSPLASKNIKLQAVFQIRHTLSHNYGLITRSDQAKFKMLGLQAEAGKIVDPDKDCFGTSVKMFLKKEAEDFTKWLVDAAANYLDGMQKGSGVTLDRRVLTRIQQGLGTSAKLTGLPWV